MGRGWQFDVIYEAPRVSSAIVVTFVMLMLQASPNRTMGMHSAVCCTSRLKYVRSSVAWSVASLRHQYGLLARASQRARPCGGGGDWREGGIRGVPLRSLRGRRGSHKFQPLRWAHGGRPRGGRGGVARSLGGASHDRSSPTRSPQISNGSFSKAERSRKAHHGRPSACSF